MAKFVRFESYGGAVSWVNPEQVVMISKSHAGGRAVARIDLCGNELDLHVPDSIEEVLRKLS